MSLEKYASKGDSVSLKLLDKEEFTIIGIEDSAYEETQKDGTRTVTPGVKITTAVSYNGHNKFHTTRVAIVSLLTKQEIREDVKNGEQLKVKIITSKTKAGKDFFEMVSA